MVSKELGVRENRKLDDVVRTRLHDGFADGEIEARITQKRFGVAFYVLNALYVQK